MPLGMRCDKPFGNSHRDRDGIAPRQRTAFEPGPQRLAFEQLHHGNGSSSTRPSSKIDEDARMRQRRRRPALRFRNAAAFPDRRRHERRHDLDGDGTIQSRGRARDRRLPCHRSRAARRFRNLRDGYPGLDDTSGSGVRRVLFPTLPVEASASVSGRRRRRLLEDVAVIHFAAVDVQRDGWIRPAAIAPACDIRTAESGSPRIHVVASIHGLLAGTGKTPSRFVDEIVLTDYHAAVHDAFDTPDPGMVVERCALTRAPGHDHYGVAAGGIAMEQPACVAVRPRLRRTRRPERQSPSPRSVSRARLSRAARCCSHHRRPPPRRASRARDAKFSEVAVGVIPSPPSRGRRPCRPATLITDRTPRARAGWRRDRIGSHLRTSRRRDASRGKFRACVASSPIGTLSAPST